MPVDMYFYLICYVNCGIVITYLIKKINQHFNTKLKVYHISVCFKNTSVCFKNTLMLS